MGFDEQKWGSSLSATSRDEQRGEPHRSRASCATHPTERALAAQGTNRPLRATTLGQHANVVLAVAPHHVLVNLTSALAL